MREVASKQEHTNKKLSALEDIVMPEAGACEAMWLDAEIGILNAMAAFRFSANERGAPQSRREI